jgi:hypothetical protein
MIEQATVHPSHADTDINLPVFIYLVHLSSSLRDVIKGASLTPFTNSQ